MFGLINIISTESCDHLFSHCVFIRYLLLSVAKLPEVNATEPCDARDLWTTISNTNDTQKRSKGLTFLAAIWWVAWNEKNHFIFNLKAPDAARALDRANLLVTSWMNLL